MTTTKRASLLAALAVPLLWSLCGAAAGAERVFIADAIELSGGGATVGTNWRDAVDLAVKDINAAGGILGRPVEVEHYDTQSNPGVSKAVITRALDQEPYVVLGPIYSSSTKVNMIVTQRAGVPQIVGSEAAEITEQGNPWIFRTSFGQAASMPKLAKYLHDRVGAQSVAIVWVNNDFGKGGRDAAVREFEKRGIDIAADISTEVQQVDFAPEVVKVKQSGADALFVYLHEEESARFLVELRKQGYERPVVGETTLMNQKVIDLAGSAANGVRGHVGLSADAPVPAVKEFAARFEQAYGYKPDHNAIKGYVATHVVKEITERIGRFDRQAFGDALHGATITPEDEPGVLMEITYDDKGDVDRESFLVEVVDGKQVITGVLPKLGD
ncbi:MAG: amino acid ABC transporter substrate-binding protein [Gammaproteobacteria bacterium]|nr:amino acid ABC transporter substrate-binding protein [Gammaproteobacteria bacterium]NIR83254.1 amino acid ABC transporter substrate-binding protein [Gammaproteobacteria bacterium]NIR91058.1 amino acid ABC transporter substrate-binding protein [Gammaproteobacteria bacterium]NIU04419.1 amino acid ABC transporter substrate-binding protein [Gammaproteobacteria bacterium]NIV76374.1 ABC transporter substrate-binding protein [Gammaproteobacteria bacterium]